MSDNLVNLEKKCLDQQIPNEYESQEEHLQGNFINHNEEDNDFEIIDDKKSHFAIESLETVNDFQKQSSFSNNELPSNRSIITLNGRAKTSRKLQNGL